MPQSSVHTRGHSPTSISEVSAVISISFESCTTQLLHPKTYTENDLSSQLYTNALRDPRPLQPMDCADGK